jgi:hypothetical protein
MPDGDMLIGGLNQLPPAAWRAPGQRKARHDERKPQFRDSAAA